MSPLNSHGQELEQERCFPGVLCDGDTSVDLLCQLSQLQMGRRYAGYSFCSWCCCRLCCSFWILIVFSGFRVVLKIFYNHV